MKYVISAGFGFALGHLLREAVEAGAPDTVYWAAAVVLVLYFVRAWAFEGQK